MKKFTLRSLKNDSINANKESPKTIHITKVLEEIKEYIKSPNFALLLELKEVIALGRTCKYFNTIFNRNYINLIVRLGNLDSNLRYLFWIHKIPYVK